MAVEVQRDRDRRVAEPFLNHLRVNASGKHEGRAGMAKVVEPDRRNPGSGDGPAERLGHRVGVMGIAVLAG